MRQEKEDTVRPVNKWKQSSRKMFRGLKIRDLYFILLLFFGAPLFSQINDSIAVNSQDIAQVSLANPQVYKLAELEISGNTKFSKNQIMRFTGLRLGMELEIPGPKISNTIKKLWKQNLFSDIELFVVKTEGDQIYLRLHLMGLSELAEVKFVGIRKGMSEDFIKELKLDPGVKITNHLKNRITQAVKGKMIEKGYPYTKVSFTETHPDDNPEAVNLLINVDRGERVKIQNIVFEGNHELRDGQLRRKAMKNTNKKSLNIFKTSKFKPDGYQEDLKKLTEVYRSIGFRDAKVVSDTVIQVDSKTLLVKIEIDEGKPYYLGDITFTGNSVFTTETLERVFSYKKGDRYDAVGIFNRISGSEKDDDLHTMYMDQGYLFSHLIPIEKNVRDDVIDLEIKIIEGEPATYNRVTFSGNDVTYDHVIARELRTKPGDLFSKTEIKRTVFELSRLGYFEPPPMLNPNIQPNPETNTVDLDWELVHKSSSQVTLQGGYGAGTLLGTLGLSFGNFSVRNLFNGKAWRPVPMGDGQTLSLQAQAGRGYQNYSFSFTEPWIGGKRPTALTMGVYYSNYDYRNTFGQRAELGIVGASVGLTKLMTWPDDWFRLSNSLSYQRYDFNNYPLKVGNLNYENGKSNNFSYTIALTRDSAGPDPIFPKEGSDISISLNLTPPYSLFNKKDYSKVSDLEKFKWLEYYKIKAHAYWYKELAGKLVVKVGGEFGYLGTYNKKIGTIPFERFYLGGTGLFGMRFDGREIIPLRGYEDATQGGGEAQDITPTGGGSVYDKFTLELRYPISMGEQAKIYGLAFAEAGNTWYDTQDFKPFELKRAAGFGIRIFMPAFGMLGFDFAYGFDNPIFSNKPSGWQSHFIIGQQL